MKKISQITFVFLFAAVIFTGCKKDDDSVATPAPPNEEELITTLKITFVDSADVNAVPKVFYYRDLDGDGGLPATSDSIKLDAHKTYYATLLLLNEAVSSVDTISNEILEEGVDHLFIYDVHDPLAKVSITDQDENGLPLGLQSTWRTGASGKTHVHIILKHQPGVKDGTEAPGQTDIESYFELVVQ